MPRADSLWFVLDDCKRFRVVIVRHTNWHRKCGGKDRHVVASPTMKKNLKTSMAF